MQMQIEIVEVSKPYVKGKWGKLDVKYTRDGGKESTKTLTAIGGTKDVIQALNGAQPGDVFTIDSEKSEDGQYWNWNAAKKVEGPAKTAAGKSSYTAGTKSTYETPEERAVKNVMIARQNALSHATALAVARGKADVGTVINEAQQMVEWVLGGPKSDEPDAPAKPAKGNRRTKDADFEDDNPFGDPEDE